MAKRDYQCSMCDSTKCKTKVLVPSLGLDRIACDEHKRAVIESTLRIASGAQSFIHYLQKGRTYVGEKI